MIAIDNIVLSDDVVQAQFVCDLERCKGGCCVDGDCGAPLSGEEVQILAEIYPKIKSYLPEAYIAEIEKQGTHVYDDEHGLVTPTVGGGICVYAFTDPAGIVKCGIEQAWKDGVVDFKKPISCHLYPLRINSTNGFDMVNYEPRKVMCRPACKLGKKLEVPVYRFLKEPLIRKYGEAFYEALEAVAEELERREEEGT
jgi:hypothetical protein